MPKQATSFGEASASWGACSHRCCRGDQPGGRDGRRVPIDDGHWKRKRHHHGRAALRRRCRLWPITRRRPIVPCAAAGRLLSGADGLRRRPTPAYGPPVGSLNFGLSVPLR